MKNQMIKLWINDIRLPPSEDSKWMRAIIKANGWKEVY